MSSAYKTLKSVDISIVPYLAKTEKTYTPCTANDEGFRIFKAKYTPRDYYLTTSSLDKSSINFLAVENMFYKEFISQSSQTSSLYNQSLQALGASGSYQTDTRIFPQSGSIVIVSIPQSLYGEKISPKSFVHKGTGSLFHLIDDGNGNIIDINNYQPESLLFNDIYSNDFIYNYYQTSSSVGNILYSHGLVVLTNTNYYCVFGGAPIIPEYYSDTFTIAEVPKDISSLVNGEIDCSTIDYTSTEFTNIEGYSFPAFTIDIDGLITLDEVDPLTTTPGIYKIKYTVLSDSCSVSNEGVIEITIVE